MDITEHNIFDITAHVMGVLDEWNLQPGQIIRLLGLEGQAKSRDLRKFRSKSKSFPFSADIVERIEHISGIVEALQTTHPFFPHPA